MSGVPARLAGRDLGGPSRLNQLVGAMVVIAAGVLLGLQYVEPDKRVLQVLAAAVVFGIAWRLDTVMGLGVLLIALPFPRGTTFGNTNFALILLLLVIWLLRFTTRTSPAPRRTALDAPIAAVLMAYVISFYNVRRDELLFASMNFLLFAASLLMFYLIVNNVRRTSDLKRFHVFQSVAGFAVLATSAFELANPGGVLIPGWIEFNRRWTEGTEIHDVRVGGPFGDYELLAEWCILHLMLFTFLFRQSRTPGGRAIYGGLLAFTGFILVSTVTRGAMLSLAVGIVYLLWLTRRRLQVVPLTILAVSSTAVLIGIEYFISRFTHSGSLIGRFTETKFIGLMPESRATTWPEAVERLMHHPFIGWGPYYSNQTGLRFWYWPHNLYLYVANLIGLIGLALFLWLLWKVWRLTKPATDDLGSRDYTNAFLLAARVQIAMFLFDQIKIEYLRHPIYQFQVWVMFSAIVAAYQIAKRERESLPAARLPAAA